MIDIDFFKPFNDHYGHGGGDICLQKVAVAMASVMYRTTDLLARYGGEEFVVVLPNTDQLGAIEIADRLRRAVEKLQICHEYSKAAPHVSISVGVATSPNCEKFRCPNEIVKVADQQLYRAKATGRNKVCA